MKDFKTYWLYFILLLAFATIASCSSSEIPPKLKSALAQTGQIFLPLITEADNGPTSVEAATPQPDAPEATATPTSTALPSGAVTVYTNGAIYTVNASQPWVDALAVRNGLILAIGSEAEVLAQAGENPTIVDLDGLMMMPGFQDAHMHALEAGLNSSLCLVSQEADFDQYFDEIQDCTAQQSGSEWVRAAGANMAALLYRDQLPIDVLDEAVPDRPVIILDDLGHGAWLNTLAMEAVGYDKLTADPSGGVILYDPDDDTRLTGIVLENAQQKVRTASIPPTDANHELAYQGLLKSMEDLAQNGVTSISDAGGYWTRGHETVWQRVLDANKLTVRASNGLYVYPDRPFDEQIQEISARFSNDAHSLLRFNQAKIYVDGILSQGTGALLSPYNESFGFPNVPDDGFLYFDVDSLNQYATELSAAGFQLHFHVTGDRGARLALDAIELALPDDTSDPRHRLTHLYLVDPADRPRFEELGVVADFQLSPDAVSAEYNSFMTEFLGTNRVNQLLPAFDLLGDGVTVTISSDWDADVLSPFNKIASILGQHAANRPDLNTILRMMTLDVAYLLHQDEMTGSIEVGKWADLIVLDQNLFEVQPNEVVNTQVLLTLLGGEEVYRYADAP